MKTIKKLNKFEDAQALWFKLSYNDIELYSLTIEDAYRTPTAQIMSKEELDKFLKQW